MSLFDLAVIGAGPGGFEAALRARELGLKVALIEKSNAGGTCLNTGCIPTKALLASTKLLSKMNRAEEFGLNAQPTYSFSSLKQRKDRIVESLRKAMTEGLRRSGVEWIQGEARFIGKNRILAGTAEIESRWIILAVGTEPISLPGISMDERQILSSSGILELNQPPASLLIIGGGVIGVEFASIFQALGTKVMIVEMLDRLIATEDEEVSRRLETIFRRKGIQIETSERVKELGRGSRIKVRLESGRELEAEKVLMAVGRKPRLEPLALEPVGVRVEKGFIVVDEYLETSTPGIFAIGDVTSRSTGLAHGASAEGIRVVENLKGSKQSMDDRIIPNCVYTDPEIASVGTYRDTSAQELTHSKILFSSIGKSHVEGETEGFIKLFVSKKDGRILGFTGIGGHVTELVHEVALAIRAGLCVRDLAQTVHAHPTESEILQMAAKRLCQVLEKN